MSRNAKIAIGSVLAVALLIAGLAPFALMLLPNPKPVEVLDVSAQPPGTYIADSSGTYHVFPRADKVEDFPGDSLRTFPEAKIQVKYRQLSGMDGYSIHAFPGGGVVATKPDTSIPKVLTLVPVKRLAPGRYYAIVARESIYGGEDYIYFEVADGAVRTASR